MKSRIAEEPQAPRRLARKVRRSAESLFAREKRNDVVGAAQRRVFPPHGRPKGTKVHEGEADKGDEVSVGQMSCGRERCRKEDDDEEEEGEEEEEEGEEEDKEVEEEGEEGEEE